MIFYQEYVPSQALKAYVTCLWTCHVSTLTAPYSHQVLPDNGIDILWQDQKDASFAVGMMTAPINVPSVGLVKTYAVRFKPGAAGYFFDLPLDELTNQRANLRELWGHDSTEHIADNLWTHQLSDRERLDRLEQHLLLRLHTKQKRSTWDIVESAIAAIENSNGLLKVESLALSLCVSRQHLAAQFRARVGISPKVFARVCRFRSAAQQIKSARQKQIDWSQLALDLGYFDQSHLIHEFQEFSGSSPDAFATRFHR
ncbi:MAG: DUF6597 domain-containing transcriptional factor [Collimonas sp.]|uniref:DUF6597 domain-containing transcriptional factor n=1 Tax=Collimonas sp. TaxID=1963772 RepID=UPI003266E3CB